VAIDVRSYRRPGRTRESLPSETGAGRWSMVAEAATHRFATGKRVDDWCGTARARVRTRAPQYLGLPLTAVPPPSSLSSSSRVSLALASRPACSFARFTSAGRDGGGGGGRRSAPLRRERESRESARAIVTLGDGSRRFSLGRIAPRTGNLSRASRRVEWTRVASTECRSATPACLCACALTRCASRRRSSGSPTRRTPPPPRRRRRRCRRPDRGRFAAAVAGTRHRDCRRRCRYHRCYGDHQQ